jgi:hypothetical protein
MKLKEEILSEIKNHKKCHRALEDRWEKSFYTIETWLRINHDLLCHPDSLAIISSWLGKDIDEITIQEEVDFKKVV